MVATEQHASPEQRQALRQRYDLEMHPMCRECGGEMVNTRIDRDDGTLRWWCPRDERVRYTSAFASEILAAVDDADALAAALIEVTRLRTELAWYADGNNYNPRAAAGNPMWSILRPALIVEDRGERARAALAPADGEDDSIAEIVGRIARVRKYLLLIQDQALSITMDTDSDTGAVDPWAMADKILSNASNAIGELGDD